MHTISMVWDLFFVVIAGISRMISISNTRKTIATIKNWFLKGGFLSVRDENPHSNSDDWIFLIS